MTKKPLILVTNDDSVNAPGIQHLIHWMKDLGEVIVVAPDSPQSGKGHAITIDNAIFVHKIKRKDGIECYSCSGTPVDCVKLASRQILNRKPDLCVSGINHGSNSSINVIYSGTMSAAVEAGIEGIPSIGFSLCDYSWDADFSHLETFVKKIASEVLKKTLPKGTVLNVNFPKKSENEIQGIKVCRQAIANWEEKFDKRKTPSGKDYYWLTGEFVLHDLGEDTDEWALRNNYISVVPTQFDLTAYYAIPEINSWNFN